MKKIIFISFLITINIFAQDPFNSPTVLPGTNSNMSLAVAFGDYDNDGWVDLLLSKGNDGTGAGYLNYIFKGSSTGLINLSISPFSTTSILSGSASWADIDNDGDLDVYIGGAGPSKPDNNLIINNGNGTFTDATANSGYGAIATDNEDSRHVGFGDYNNDGYPDVFVENGSVGLFGPQKANNTFYSNDGDGTFSKENESTIGNIAYTGSSLNEYRTFGSGFGWSDFNNDGYLDIFNCSGGGNIANILWKNNPITGKFEDATPSVLQPSTTSFIGSSWADYDNDGDFDLYAYNTIDGPVDGTNYLFENSSTTSTVSFSSVTGIGPIVTDLYHSVGGAWGDYDNDGDLDLFVSNKQNSDVVPPAVLYGNNGSSGGYSFTKIKDYFYPGASDDFKGRGAAMADINNDGFLDIVVARDGSPLSFLNTGSSSNKFSIIELVGTGTTNKKALGSRVKVTANIPEQSSPTVQLREISGQTGGGGQNDMRAHFGLGTTTKIAEIRAQWLNSTGGSAKQENVYTDLPTNKFIVFTQGDLNVTSDVIKAQNFMYLFGNTGGSIEFTTADTDGGTLTMLRTDSDPGGSFSGNSTTNPGGGTITANAVYPDKYWTASQTDLTGFSSTIYFDGNGLTGSPDLDDVVLLQRANSGSDWVALNTDRIGNTLYSSGITSFSEFAIGYEEAPQTVLLETKIFLEGAYDVGAIDPIMRADLTVPVTSPYIEDVRTIDPLPADIVDWVLVELRATDTGSADVSKSALLHKDGRIVNDDASSGQIELEAAPGSYYIVIKHRNHLSVMSADVHPLNSSTAVLYDFTN